MQHISPEWVLEAAKEEFSITLRRLREQVGRSGYQLAELGGLDRVYLHRLEVGMKTNPSQSTVLKIAAGLVRSGADILVVDLLLITAGHLPIFVFAEVPPMVGGTKRR